MELGILTAMLAPAFFLSATASLLICANTRVARIVDHTRALIAALPHAKNAAVRDQIEAHIEMQLGRSMLMMRIGQLLHVAMTSFVCTSLAIAADSLGTIGLGKLPVWLASAGVLAILAASILLARESYLCVRALRLEVAQRQTQATCTTS